MSPPLPNTGYISFLLITKEIDALTKTGLWNVPPILSLARHRTDVGATLRTAGRRL